MSIIALADGESQSSLELEDLHRLATGLGFEISSSKDGEEYLVLLRSFEAVMQRIDESSDYIHPSLIPQAIVGTSRDYHRPDNKDNRLNAWSHRCDLHAAHPTSDLLKGRTVAIKDSISVGGLPTTLGTHPEILCGKEGQLPVSPVDATVVARILSAGAIIKGTSNCENFCASPLSWTCATGPVHHPSLHGYTSGGSSSGSCALVAAKEVQMAVGGDQAGSIRNPAAYTGLYGLKPTFGLVPYTGAASMSPMIDHLGPIASTLEDIALLLKVMAGYDGIDARMTPESPLVSQVLDYPGMLADYRATMPARQQRPAMRIGILTESLEVSGLGPEVRDLIRQTATDCFEAAGAEVIDISVPMHAEAPIIWTAATRPSMSQWLCQGKPSGHLSYLPPHIKPQWPPTQSTQDMLTDSNPALVNIHLSGEYDRTMLPPSLEAKAHRKVFELRAAYDTALSEVAVLITPVAPTVAMPHPRARDAEGNRTGILERLKPAIGLTSNTCPFNVTGHPALSVPCGTLPAVARPDVQLPVGMQIVGRRWDDIGVLKAAALFETGRKLMGK